MKKIHICHQIIIFNDSSISIISISKIPIALDLRNFLRKICVKLTTMLDAK